MPAGPVNASTAVEDPATAPSGPPPSTAPLLLWLLIQLGAILLVVLRVPLAAGYPEPAERLAPHLLLAVQVVAAGMLFPFLLRDWRAAVQVIATAVPFQLASGYLAGIEARAMLPAMAFCLSWILLLALWRPSLGTARARMLGVSVATCLTLGGGILHYLRLEFAAGSSPGTPFETASPLLTTFAALDVKPLWPGWVLLAVLAVGTLAATAFNRIAGRKTMRKSVGIAQSHGPAAHHDRRPAGSEMCDL